MNKIISDACKHIVKVFEADDTQLDYGEVLNKFEHFLTNESLVTKNRDVLNALYSKCISNERLMRFVVNELYGSVNEGFYNPFVSDDEQVDIFDNEMIYGDENHDVKDENDTNVEEITLDDNCVGGKIYYKDGKMFSGVNLRPGEVIEFCPVVRVDRTALCSRQVRDIAFQISKDDEYGIPMGYANMYRTSEDAGVPGNIDYEYPEDSDVMRFITIDNIKPNDELVLRVEEEPMALR